MGKVDGCLKCVFIFFNTLFAIVGGLLVYGMVQISGSKEFSEVGGSGLFWSWLFAIAILGIPTLGICAACSENICALQTFAGFMGTGMIIMLIAAFSIATKGNQVKEGFNSIVREHRSDIMQDVQIQELLKHFQESDKCCGLMRAEDWGYRIPESCACYDSSKCKSRPYGTTGPDKIYAQGCREIISQYIDIGLNIAKGVSLGFSAIALLGLLISLCMINQIKRHDSPAGEYFIPMKDF